MDTITFAAVVDRADGVGGWHYVLIPGNALAELREIAGKNGNIPVLVTVGKSTWPTTIMSMGDQRWFIALKSAIRKAEDIDVGSKVTVAIKPDFDRFKL